VLAVNLFVVVMVSFSLRDSQYQYRLRAESTARNLCQVLEQNLVGTIDKVDLALLAVKGEAEREIAAGGIHGMTLDAFIAQQSGYVPAINNLRIVNALGEVTHGTHLPPGRKIILADRDYFRQLRDDSHAELVTSKPLIGYQDGRPLVIFARRISRTDGSFAGVVFAAVTIDHLAQALSLMDVGKNGVVTLRRKDMTALARYPIAEGTNAQLGQTSVAPEFQGLFNEGRTEGTYTTLSRLDGVERTFAFRRTSGHPFFIVLGLATGDYLAEWRHEATRMWTLTALFCLFTFLGCGVIYYVWKRQLATHEALRESERFLRTVIDLVPHLIFVKDRESRYLLVNRACAEAYGTTPAQMVGRHTAELVSDPSHVEAFLKADREVLDGGIAKFIAEEEIRDASGGRRLHQTNKVPFVSSRTGEAALIGVSVDITDYKQAQQALAESKERLRTIVELAPDGIFVVSEQGQILEVNEAACQQLGYRRDQLLQLKLFDIIAPQFAERVQARLKGGVPSGSYESAHIRSDGVEVPLELSVTNILFRGQPAFLGITRDITERKRAEEAIRKSEAKFRAIVENSHDGILFLNAKRLILYRSPSYQQINGYSDEERLGHIAFETAHPDDLAAIRQIWTELLNRPEALQQICYRTRHKDGTWRWVESSARNLLGNVNVQAVVLTTRDVTERKQAEQALRESEAGLAAAQRIAHIGSWQWDPQNNTSSWSDETFRIFGLVPNQVKPHHKVLVDLLLPADQELVDTALSDALSGAGEYDLEYRICLPDGAKKVIHSQAEVLRNADGKPVMIRGTVHDITERKQAEQALRDSEARVRLTFDRAPIGANLVDLDGRLIQVNDAYCRFLGYQKEELLGRKVTDVSYDPEPDVKRLQQLLEGQIERFSEDKAYVRKDGQVVWGHVTVQVLKDTTGQNFSLLAMVEDITARKQAEEEKAKLQNQLLQAQKLESVGQLAGGVAHDFNNLLQVINGYSDLLLRKLKHGDPLKAQVAEIRRAGDQGAALTRQLLVFSREQIIEPKPLDLNDLIHESQVMLQRLMGEDIEIETTLSRSLGLVMADPGRLHQVLMNLAANSRDAMLRGGKFTIKTVNMDVIEGNAAGSLGLKPGPFVLLQISDTGTGIPKEIQERVFDPFFTTKEHGKGTGLGLATVYGIVRQSGGAIAVSSEPGHGTTFDIYLPRVEVCALNATEAKTPAEPLRGMETLLVVEDRPEVRRLAVDALEASGYQVLEAAGGSEALRVAQRHPGPIHLLLTDVVMPHMTGKELAERLKSLLPEIKVLYMSGYAADVISSRGLLDSGERYISKPFSLDSLLAKVRELLNSASAHAVR
jgi:PAS domain S-box-containing protein